MNYVSYEIKHIIPEKPLPSEVYLFVSGHFIKYKSEGDVFPSRKYNQLISKKILFVFVELEKLQNFKDWTSGKIAEDVEQRKKIVGDKHDDFIELEVQIKDLVWSSFTEVLDESSVKSMEGHVKKLIGKVNDSLTLQGALANIHENGEVFAQHAYNVATLSTYLAINLGMSQMNFLQTVFMGAIFHDYGKLQSNAEEGEIEGDGLILDKRHPMEGKIQLGKKTELPFAVLKIVEEHHERFDGKGFPNKLKRSQISEGSQIVSIANVFDNYFSKAKGSYQQKQIYALKCLGKLRGTYFDKYKLDKCMKILFSSIKKK